MPDKGNECHVEKEAGEGVRGVVHLGVEVRKVRRARRGRRFMNRMINARRLQGDARGLGGRW
jgi:hypothetical protein